MEEIIPSSQSPVPQIENREENKNSPKPKYFIFLIVILMLLILISIGTYLFLNSNVNKLSIKNAKDKSQATTSQNTLTPNSQEDQLTDTAKTDALNIHNLPLGDGMVSNSPKVGYVYSCQTQFKTGGAEHVGNWIHGNTWDLTQKTTVQGNISWPQAQFAITENGQSRVISGNGLPVETKTGTFPIQISDPAYLIDRNPNSIKPQNISMTLSLNPSFLENPNCVPMGMIGVALNGVAIYNALDASGRDAVAHEVQDLCDGHPQSVGEYHYHGPSVCLPNETKNNTLIGYAIDGFGIYSMYDKNGKEITNAGLDACHGTTGEVLWNGKLTNIYHYVLTREYPYTIGCFRGSVSKAQLHPIDFQNP